MVLLLWISLGHEPHLDVWRRDRISWVFLICCVEHLQIHSSFRCVQNIHLLNHHLLGSLVIICYRLRAHCSCLEAQCSLSWFRLSRFARLKIKRLFHGWFSSSSWLDNFGSAVSHREICLGSIRRDFTILNVSSIKSLVLQETWSGNLFCAASIRGEYSRVLLKVCETTCLLCWLERFFRYYIL